MPHSKTYFRDIQNHEAAVLGVLMDEAMSLQPEAFKQIDLDIDSINVKGRSKNLYLN